MEVNRLMSGNSNSISKWDGVTLPTFPFSTDGVDVSGSNIIIERLNITNFDDAVAVKPSTKAGKLA